MEQSIKIIIPETWADVTVGQYTKLDVTDLIGATAILWNLDRSVVEHLDMGTLELLEHLAFLKTEPNPVISKEIYGCKLVEILDLSVGDIEDLERLCADFKNNAAHVVAWLYRNEQTPIDRAEMLSEKMNVEQLFGVASYFGLTTGMLIAPDAISEVFGRLNDLVKDPELLTEMMVKITDSPEDVTRLTDKIKKDIDGQGDNS